MRTADKADPDPELMTVALRIWPAMLIITLTNLIFLVYIAGLSGGYAFITIFVNFLTTYLVLWKTMKVTKKEASGDRKEQVPQEEMSRLAIENEKEASSEDKEESEGAAIEMSKQAADTRKDIESEEEELQAEAKTEDEKEADDAQMPTPPPTEMPDMAAKSLKSARLKQRPKTTRKLLELKCHLRHHPQKCLALTPAKTLKVRRRRSSKQARMRSLGRRKRQKKEMTNLSFLLPLSLRHGSHL